MRGISSVGGMGEAGSVRRVKVEQNAQRLNGAKLVATLIVIGFKKERYWSGHFAVRAEILHSKE